MREAITSFWRDEEAVTTVEYALLLTIIVAGSVGAWTALGETIENVVTDATAKIGTPSQ